VGERRGTICNRTVKKVACPLIVLSYDRTEYCFMSVSVLQQLGRSNSLIRSFKYFSGMLNVVGPFLECERVPFAARHGEEVAAINMDRCCDLIKRIGN